MSKKALIMLEHHDPSLVNLGKTVSFLVKNLVYLLME